MYSQALDIQPESVGIYNNLGVALYKHGKCDKAIETYQRAIQIQPDFLEAYNNLDYGTASLRSAQNIVMGSTDPKQFINITA